MQVLKEVNDKFDWRKLPDQAEQSFDKELDENIFYEGQKKKVDPDTIYNKLKIEDKFPDLAELIQDIASFVYDEQGESSWVRMTALPTYGQDEDFYNGWLYEDRQSILAELKITNNQLMQLYTAEPDRLKKAILGQAKEDLFLMWLYDDSPLNSFDNTFKRQIVLNLKSEQPDEKILNIFRDYFYKQIYKTINIKDIEDGLMQALQNYIDELQMLSKISTIYTRRANAVDVGDDLFIN